MKPKRNQGRYPRTARLNELLREIVAEELERLDDDRLELLAITQVVVEGDVRRAKVYFDTLAGGDADATALEALGEHRVRLQGAIGRQTRLKRTPELVFEPDAVQREAERLEGLMRDLDAGE